MTSRKKPLDFPRFEDAGASNVAVAEHQALAVTSVVHSPSLPGQSMTETGQPNKEAGSSDDEDEVSALFDMISKLDEEKESLEFDVKHKSDEVEKMARQQLQLKTELDQIREEHEEFRNSVEVDKFGLLEGYEVEKDLIHKAHQEETRGLIEEHQKRTEELLESYEQEKDMLQQSHKEKQQSQQASFAQEREALQKATARESERFNRMLEERNALLQEKAGALEKLQTTELAKVEAEKGYDVLLDRVRDLARHAQCQTSKPTPGPEPKQGNKKRRAEKALRGMFSGLRGTSTPPDVNSPTTLDCLDADAAVQKVTERIDQLLSAESKVHEVEMLCEDFRSQNASLTSELSTLQGQIETLQSDTVATDRLSEQIQDQTVEMDELRADYEQRLETFTEQKHKLERRVGNQRAELSSLNNQLKAQQDEIANMQDQQRETESPPPSIPRRLAISVNTTSSDRSEWATEDSYDTVIVLCIDLCLTPRHNTIVRDLVEAMFDKADNSTRFSVIAHGDSNANMVQSGTNSEIMAAATARTLFADDVDLGCRMYPSYNSAMSELEQLHRIVRREEAKMVVYLIRDGSTGKGSFDPDTQYYPRFRDYLGEIRLWSFCPLIARAYNALTSHQKHQGASASSIWDYRRASGESKAATPAPRKGRARATQFFGELFGTCSAPLRSGLFLLISASSKFCNTSKPPTLSMPAASRTALQLPRLLKRSTARPLAAPFICARCLLQAPIPARAFTTTPRPLKKSSSNPKSARKTPQVDAPNVDRHIPDNKATRNRDADPDPYDHSELQAGIDKALARLKDALTKTRDAGRVSTEMLESLPVEINIKGHDAKGGSAHKEKARLGDLASVVPKGGRTMQVFAAEEGHVKPLVAAIQASDYSLAPEPAKPGDANANALCITVPVPPVTAETRQQAVAEAKKCLERAQLEIRNARGDAQKRHKTMEKQKLVVVDELRKAHKGMEEVAKKGADEAKKVFDGAVKALQQ